MRIEVRGSARLARTMRAAGRDLADLSAANTDAADTARRAIVARAPVRTGRLRASLRADGTPTEARITSNLPYAGVIEYGWPAHHISPSGFARDGLASSQRAWIGVYDDAIEDALDQVKGI